MEKKRYVITILNEGRLYDEIIFSANEDEAIIKMADTYVNYDSKYTMHLSLYLGNGRKGKMISYLNKFERGGK